MVVELRQWRYFLAVAEHRSVTRAAASLHLDQPSLSRQIRQLERVLGFDLFVRGPRAVELSPAGHELLEPARRLVLDAAELERRAAQHVRRAAGTVLVGTAEWYPYTAALGVAVQRLTAATPPLVVELAHLAWWDHLAAVVERRIDAGFAVTIRLADLDEPVDGLLIRPDPVRHALLPASHRLAGEAQLRCGQLAGFPLFVAPANTQPYVQAGTLSRLGEAAGRELTLAPTLGAFSQATQSIAAGSGWTVVPDTVAAHPPPGTAARRLTDVTIETGVYLVWRDDAPVRELRRLAEALRHAASDEQPPSPPEHEGPPGVDSVGAVKPGGSRNTSTRLFD